MSSSSSPAPAEQATEQDDTSREVAVAAALSKALEIDTINRQRLALIKKTVAEGATDAEVGMFLELAAKYDLDPFAHEVWCVKGKGRDGSDGRLLIMVGRDGLRKIAARSSIHIDGDVVHENDEFTITRTPTGNRTVAHSYGKPQDRGELIGAWAECRAGGPLGRPLGFFYAPLEEYMPTNEAKLKYSPWGSQRSVMILAAAERQALRQATPLSGLLVEGEADRNLELEAGGIPTPAELQATINRVIPAEHCSRAEELIHDMNALAPGTWTPGKAEMVFAGKTAYAITAEFSAMERAIDELRARGVQPAVAEEPDGEPAEAEVVDEAEAVVEPREPTPSEQRKIDRINELAEAIAGDELTEQQRSDADAEIDALRGELPPEVSPEQGTLL